MSAVQLQTTPVGLAALVVVFAAVLLPACRAPQPATTPPATVPHLDLDRYVGRWYEVAKIPNRFQRHCVSDTTAEYARDPDGTITVINRCRTSDGSLDEARAIARVVDTETNAKLEVSFFSLLGWRPVWGDYWVLALGPNYEYAVVGESSRRYGWILSRTTTLPASTRDAIDEELRALGYEPAQFQISTHFGNR